MLLFSVSVSENVFYFLRMFIRRYYMLHFLPTFDLLSEFIIFTLYLQIFVLR